MQQIIAIALLSIRNAIRSKMVLSLLLLLLLVVMLIPLSIKGDGTIAGLIQVLLSYTLGLSVFILALTSLWAGSASVSTEINNKTIQMMLTKPVSTWQLWTGKWIGLCMLNACCLALCGAVTYGMLQWHIRQAASASPGQAAEASRLLTARQELVPIMPDLMTEARNRLNEQIARQALPENVTREQALRDLHQQLQLNVYTIRPAGQKRWTFPPPHTHEGETTVTLQYRFSSSIIGQDSTRGRWLIGTTERPDLLDLSRESVPRALNELVFTIDNQWKDQALVLTYIDTDTSGASLIFDFQNGLVLLTPAGTFPANYLRTILILFGQIAFFTALGVTAGSLFSLPVAVFVSLFLLILIQMGSYIQGIAQTEIIWPWQAVTPEQVTAWSSIAITMIFRGIAFVMSPLIHESALNSASTGRLVNLLWTFKGFILQGVAYSLVMGWLSSLVLKRRELALPQS